jgi:hypothetical protein
MVMAGTWKHTLLDQVGPLECDFDSRLPKTGRGIDKDIITLHHLSTDLQLSISKIIETPIWYELGLQIL